MSAPIEQVRQHFEAAWQSKQRPRLEDYVAVPEPERSERLRALLPVEAVNRRLLGELPTIEEYQQRFPALPLQIIRQLLDTEDGHTTMSLPGRRGEPMATDADTQSRTVRQVQSFSTPEVATEAYPMHVGRYEIQAVLGKGGFGTVYRGWDPQLGRMVAIKVPIANAEHTARDIEVFLDEARRAAQLDHPGIITVHDVGLDRNQGFIVQQLIDGPTLAQRLGRQPIELAEAIRLVAELAEIVHFAHERGWVHRDIKPSNVLLDSQGRPHLGDFGIAARLDALRVAPGNAQGTPYYMAPEVVQLALPKDQQRPDAIRPDHRADIYSLGVILYQLVTGRLPYQAATTRAIFEMILHNDPLPPRLVRNTVPPKLEEVCLKALARNPADRYRTGLDFRDALLAAVTLAPPLALPVASRSKQWLIVGGAVALALIAVVIAVTSRSSAPTQPGGPLVKLKEQPSGPLAKAKSELSGAKLEAFKEFLKEREPVRPIKKAVQPSGGGNKDPAIPPPLLAMQAKARKAATPDEEWNILLDLTNRLIEAGCFETARKEAERMVEISKGEQPNTAMAHGQLGLALYRLGDYEAAVAQQETALKDYRKVYDELVRRGVDAAKRSGMARLVGLTLLRIGNINKEQERYENAEAAYLEAKTLLEKYDDRKSELISVLQSFGGMQSNRGRHQEAMAMLEQGAKLARELKDPAEEADILVNLGNAQSRAGDNKKAIETYAKADALMPPTASYEARSLLLFNWIASLCQEGRFDEAKPLYQRLRRMARPNDARATQMLDKLGKVLGS